jgi:hypothetical protein
MGGGGVNQNFRGKNTQYGVRGVYPQIIFSTDEHFFFHR